jgi:hypothetical protein
MSRWQKVKWAMFLLLLVAVVGATAIVNSTTKLSYPESLAAMNLADGSPDEQAAYARYPDKAPHVYLHFRGNPVFEEVIGQYGYTYTVPVVYRCLTIGDEYLDASYAVMDAGSSLLHGSLPQGYRKLESLECAAYALSLMHEYGFDFYSQYVLDEHGAALRLPGSSVIAYVKRQLSHGLSVVERKKVLDQSVKIREYAEAALDIVGFIGIGKVAGKGVSLFIAKKASSTSTRVGLRAAAAESGSIARRLAPGVYRKAAKYTVIGATTYLAIAHPSVVTGFLGYVADRVGIPPALLQVAGWTVLIWIGLIITSWIWMPVLTAFLVMLRIYRLVPRRVRTA